MDMQEKLNKQSRLLLNQEEYFKMAKDSNHHSEMSANFPSNRQISESAKSDQI